MSSLPSEILRDVLLPLDRWTLDGVQFTNHRFLQLILERMSDVCLRRIHRAFFDVPKEEENTHASSYMICVDFSGSRETRDQHEDTARLFTDFVQALRSSCVGSLAFRLLVFTPELATLVLQAPILVGQLEIFGGSFADLTPSLFHKVLLHFSPYCLWLSSHLRACQISNEFVRALFESRVQRASFPIEAPVDGGSFCVTDDAIVGLCMQPDAQVSQEGGVQSKELRLYNGCFTKDLFRRLIEASALSKRTQPLRIVVFSPSVDDDNLRDFEHRLSYRDRGQPRQVRIYDFLGEQHGAVAAVDLQIVLHSDNTLEIIRARRPDCFFRESYE